MFGIFDIFDILLKIIGVIILICVIHAVIEWIKEHWLTIIFVIVEIVVFIRGEYKVAGVILLLFLSYKVISKFLEWIKERTRIKRILKQKKENRQKIKAWILEGKEVLVDVDQVMLQAVRDFKQDYEEYFDHTNMPYGRAISFITHFTSSISDDEEFYFFLPKKTINVYDMRENGLLIAKSGIYMIYEETFSEENVVCKKSLLFKDCYLYDENTQSIKLINQEKDGFNDTSIAQLFRGKKYSGLQTVVCTVLAYKIPQLYNYSGMNYKNTVDIDTIEYDNDFYKKWAEIFAIISSAKPRNELYNELKNYMNGNQGGGYAAEYANNTIDRLFGKDVINAAQILDSNGRQIKDGVDRIVDRMYIQSKYYKNAQASLRSAFPGGKCRYTMNGKPMQIEVPRDQYLECCEIAQKNIDNGKYKVPAGTTGKDIVRKGYVTYAQAQNIAKALTVEGLTIDAINGIRCTLPGTTVSAAIVFAMEIVKGKELGEAFKSSAKFGVKTVGKGMGIYVLTEQLSRSNVAILSSLGIENPISNVAKDLAEEIKNSQLAGTTLGESLGLKNLTNKKIISTGITAIIIVGPDMFQYFSGRISGQQLFKNVAVTGGGIVGAGIASSLGILAGPLGAIVGGALGSFVTKSVLDEYIEDDGLVMFRIFKEEYLDCVTPSGLNKAEQQKLAKMTLLSNELPQILKDMYSVENSREFAKTLIEQCIINILEERPKVTKAMFNKGFVSYLQGKVIQGA